MALNFNRKQRKKSFSDDFISSIRMNVGKNPDNIAVTFGDRKLTWGEIWNRSNCLANGLISLGLKQHDRVLIFLPNCLEYPEAILGINKAGCVATGGNVRLTGPEITYQLNDSEARAVILMGPGELKTILSVADQIPSLDHIIMIEDKVIEGTHRAHRTHNYYKLIGDHQPNEPSTERSPSDIHLIMYTSGTTGKPKAAARTYKGDYHMANSVCHEMALTPDDVYLAVAPMYAAASMGYVLSTMLIGGTVAIVPGFVPDQFFPQIEKTRATWTFMVPIMYEWALKISEDIRIGYDISSIRSFIACGAPLSNATAAKMLECFPNAQISNWLGASEFGFISKYVYKDKLPAEGCVGKPLFDLELAIFDEKGNRVPVNEPGVLYGRGYSMFEGYLNKPEATEETFLDHEWGTVSDIARLGEDGNLYIVDRKNDMIITGGLNVYPVEIEHILMGNENVADVAVIGVPDEKWGEAVKALVVKGPDSDPSEADIIAYCKNHIAGFKVPKSVEFIDQVPRSQIGKALKAQLKKKYWVEKAMKI